MMKEETLNSDNSFAEVCVESPSFSFNCAHFIAYNGFRETLHGHNYNVSLKVRGYVRDDGYVIDFSILKEKVKKVCNRLDHHFILPIYSDVLKFENVKNNIKIICEDNSEYSFPERDCIKLPIKHSSTEEIGQYILNQLIEEMDVSLLKSRHIHYIEISVSESPTQKAIVHKYI
ncbi:6-pyruvoyltetrahydropterin synthase [Plasmodium reichenowi]|uniref:6-pyruvoyltetrahydropterin synthase n=1 Tax=Plasmodium reichenowi TaxID=5854 RepID=A0A060RV57_PLARE|nr:6-pyruvoyltetrahydropterin synthase [Plasmodium reichenowi]KYO01159.1 6-pyruvoyltetrahydropterin synthase [Plasmodium reichenowi]CDO63464.1 6-pyruvoyltetrahydropterin synthase [Plasmodium reichenowi]SOV77619.1 6-pyruvoyltetrahydropterin synthase [Plasmodium reichenowi]